MTYMKIGNSIGYMLVKDECNEAKHYKSLTEKEEKAVTFVKKAARELQSINTVEAAQAKTLSLIYSKLKSDMKLEFSDDIWNAVKQPFESNIFMKIFKLFKCDQNMSN